MKIIDTQKARDVLAALEFQRAQAQEREQRLSADIKRLTQAIVDVASFEHLQDLEER